MAHIKRYESWLYGESFDETTKSELKAIKDSEREIEERFYKDLEFGTGGLRGILGAGTNRMNVYTVGRATQGISDYIKSKGYESPKAVISYDTRHFSREFAMTAARVFAANGIEAYLFSDVRPTPMLSFAVREIGATCGIMVTASHNPPQYNGYKAYWSDGGQIVSPIADELISTINSISDFSCIKYIDEHKAIKEGKIKYIEEELDDIYFKKVRALVLNPSAIKKATDLKIIYTPLHGTGSMPVQRILRDIGFECVYAVESQTVADPDFSTVKSPNPEEHEAFTLAIELAKSKGADIIIGTDPDCDRVGAAVKNKEGEYIVLTGNETGALLIHYILSSLKEQGLLNKKSTIINTIVTGKLGETIARDFGVNVISTLTGFKYIGEKIEEFEKTNENEFVFGYEESYGYLAGTFVRDKDAVIAAMLICEMAAWYSNKGMTLYDALISLKEKYGHYKEELSSISFPGKDGMERMKGLIDSLRQNPIKKLLDFDVIEIRDYLTQSFDPTLRKENMLYYVLSDSAWLCIRPSGTEPKLKIYYGVAGCDFYDADAKIKKLILAVSELLKSFSI